MSFQLMVGNLWTEEYLDRCIEINKTNPKARIAEMYGSLKTKHNPVGSARPDSRIPEVSLEFFEEYIQKANANGIDINYTINSTCVGNLIELGAREAQIAYFLQDLEKLGVKRVTVAHPIIAKLVAKHSDLAVEISTIMHVETMSQLDKFLWMCPTVDKICMNIYKNRDFNFLKEFKREADKQDIIVELMANEFCTIGGAPCLGLYRMSCYMVHSHGGNDSLEFDGYPIKGPDGCITSRIQSPASYLKARFILPQWYDLYKKETGIEHFKITGRTHTYDQIMPAVEAYTSGHFKGNLLDLWLLDKDHADLDIPAEELDKKGFIEHWVDFSNKRNVSDFPCASLCEGSCDHCERVMREICPTVPHKRIELYHQFEGIGIEDAKS